MRKQQTQAIYCLLKPNEALGQSQSEMILKKYIKRPIESWD